MKIDFNTYFLTEFKQSHTNFRLYHDWVYDILFANLHLDKELQDLIRKTIHIALDSGMRTGEMIKVNYWNCLRDRALMPIGPHRGVKIMSLSNNDRSLLPELYKVIKHQNEYIAKAAKTKIEQIKFYTDKQ